MKKVINVFVLIIILLFIFNNINAETSSNYKENFKFIHAASYDINNIIIDDFEIVKYSNCWLINCNIINDSPYDNNITLNYKFYKNYTESLNSVNGKTQFVSAGKTIFYSVAIYPEDLGTNLENISYYDLHVTKNQLATIPIENFDLTPSLHSKYNKDEYVIDKYDVDIKVNENNIVDVTEKILVKFNDINSNFIRKIPLILNEKDYIKTQVSNINTNIKYKLYDLEGNKELIFEKPDSNIKEYIIKYSCNMGKDIHSNYDKFEFNLINKNFNTVIGNISFNVEMPKSFSKDNLSLYCYNSYIKSSDNIDYTVTNNTITGKVNQIIGSKVGLYIDIKLDDNYFINSKYEYNKSTITLFFLAPIVFLLMSIAVWYKSGRDAKIKKELVCYPPDEYSSLDAGFIYNESVDENAIESLLIQFAQKGYIKIIEKVKPDKPSEIDGYEIAKLKEYDGTNKVEKMLFEEIFKHTTSSNNSYNNLCTVAGKNLSISFPHQFNRILETANLKKNKKRYFDLKTSSKSIYVAFFLLMSLITVFCTPLIGYIGYSSTGITAFILTLCFPLILLLSKNIWIFFKLAFGVGIMFLMYFVMVTTKLYKFLLYEPIYLFGFVIGLGCIVGIYFCFKYMSRKTEKGIEMYSKICNLRDFINNATSEELFDLVEENENYFYEILPYAYALGCSKVWVEKFKFINISTQLWYLSTYGDLIDSMDFFVSKTMPYIHWSLTCKKTDIELLTLNKK